MKKNAREYCLEAVYDIFQNDAYSNITLNKIFKNNNIDELDKKYITEIVYGTVKNKIYLEYILKIYAKGRVKAKVRYLLLISLYQILSMSKTPSFAVVNEAVKIAKKNWGYNSGKYVNAVLRNILREQREDNIIYKNEEEKFLILNSCPKELFDILKNQYGLDKAKSIIKSFLTKSKNSIRVNLLKNSKEELLEKFEIEKIKVTASDICEDCLLVDKINFNSDLFIKGNYIIQDEASALVAMCINEHYAGNFNIIDVCSAPGGKSLHIATRYPKANILSCDKYDHKLNLIMDNANRLGINNINVLNQDATKVNSKFNNSFDIVVCDVPCSGIGVIKNKPEIKYKINNDYVNKISKLQYEILENSKNYVKDNGILIYSTCTIDKRENIENINKFLSNNKHFCLEKINIKSIVKEESTGIINILPDEYDCDGFFIAKLRKVGK